MNRSELNRHHEYILKYIKKRGVSASEAEEVAQEAFLVAIKKRLLSSKPESVRPILTRIAAYLILNWHRKKRRQLKAEASLFNLKARTEVCQRHEDQSDAQILAVDFGSLSQHEQDLLIRAAEEPSIMRLAAELGVAYAPLRRDIAKVRTRLKN